MRRDGDFDALADLEAQLNERIVFLRNLTPATSCAGLWKNHDFELLIMPAGDGVRYRAMFGMTTFGWAKYQCHFTAEFAASEKGLAASAAHNTDLDEDSASTLFMVRSALCLR
jgi:hypothetical protein